MLEQVRKTIEQQGLIQTGDRILVALSGGADSVCLLDALLCLAPEASFAVFAAHLNHSLRGAEADGDEAFVQKLCQEKNVPLFCRRQDVKALAKEQQMTLEEAGRHARYAFFKELAEQHGFTKIATAHHANDNAETVLMHVLRGASVAGMAGIPFQNGMVIRPLLEVSRQEIEAYIKERGLSYRTDSTNTDTAFTRNRLRYDLLPLLEKEYNPALVTTLLVNSKLFASCQAFLQQETEERFARLSQSVWGGYAFCRRDLLEQPPYMVQSLLRLALRRVTEEKEIGAVLVERIYDILKEGSGAVCITRGVTASMCYDSLYIRRELFAPAFCYTLSQEGSVRIEETGDVLELVQGDMAEALPHEACFDAKALGGKALRVRSRRAGDVFCPVGMTGTKSVREYFIDKKIPRFLRETVPIVTADEDVIWVAGFRADRRYLAKEDCSRILRLRLIKGEQHEKRD